MNRSFIEAALPKAAYPFSSNESIAIAPVTAARACPGESLRKNLPSTPVQIQLNVIVAYSTIDAPAAFLTLNQAVFAPLLAPRVNAGSAEYEFPPVRYYGILFA